MDSDQYFWDDLIQFIEEKSVIPIIGPELLTLEIDGRTTTVYQHLGGLLADSLRVPRDGLPAEFTLSDVILAYLGTPGSRREFMYRRMRSILTDTPLPTPEPLRRLAGIGAFNLFVTTTIDSLLENAVDEVRFQGRKMTQSLAYTINEIRDLPGEVKGLAQPVVFHLFGRISSQPDYVLTDEDTLEFIHSLQSETRRPSLLFDELKNHHLLLLGNNYSDWLTRFFIRTVRNERLAVPLDREAIVVGDMVYREQGLVTFLSSPLSYGTKVLEGGAAAFVQELSDRWRSLHPEEASPTAEEPSAAEEPPADLEALPELVQGGVFISYASQDVDIVEKSKLDLEDAGLDVWFDKRRLEAGDDYDQKIQRSIRKCALFCPFVSRATEERLEGYFRREWRYALDRSLNLDQSVPFILPVVVDDTDPYASRTPLEFQKLQWTRLKSGRLPEDFVRKVVQLVRDYRKRARG
ncbi:MAG: toll/interleukin-1 receptor domain-containing protein [Thermodesulfobacteriota bacterium]